MVKGFIKGVKGVLGIDDLEQRVDDLGQRLSTVERQMKDGFRRVEEKLSEFGNFKAQNDEKLADMGKENAQLIGVVESLVQFAESKEGSARAKALLTRLRNHQTRIRNVQKARAAGD